MTDKRCGNCRYFQKSEPLPENIVLRAKYKAAHPEDICLGDGKPRRAEDKPCLIWMERKGERCN